MAEKQYRDQEYLKNLGNHLKSIRENKKLTQEQFAEFCDIDTRQLRRIERAETNSTISILKKISDKLNITVQELLSF